MEQGRVQQIANLITARDNGLFTFPILAWSLRSVAFLVLLTSTCNVRVQAQVLRVQEGPYYVGENILLQVSLESDGQDPPPCTWEPPEGMELLGPNLSTSMQSTIINGRVATSRSYTYSFNVIAAAPGRQTIGPFIIKEDGKEKETNSLEVVFQEAEIDSAIILELDADLTRVYEGQRVPVTLRWGLIGRMAEVNSAFQSLSISSPVFDCFEIEAAPAATNQTLSIKTSSGEVRLDAEAARTRVEGRDAVVLSSEFYMTARRQINLSQTSVRCRTQRVVSQRRSFFGVEQETVPIRGQSLPFDVAILPIPSKNRPKDFSGAVGSKFEIEVAANRDEVRVGDPIGLEIKLRGDGAIQRLSLPSLADDPVLAAGDFTVPAEPPSGSFTGEERQFKVTVRAKNADVTEFPGIAFNWFDPITETFQSTRSQAVPLRVLDTQIVSANSVVGGVSSLSEKEVRSAVPVADAVAANLAISKDIASLAHPAPQMQLWSVVTLVAYCLSGALVPIAWFFSVVRSRDPEQSRRAASKREAMRDLDAAAKQPVVEACQTLCKWTGKLTSQSADAGSEMKALNDSQRSIASSITADCDRIRYSPSPQSHEAEVQVLIGRLRNLLREIS